MKRPYPLLIIAASGLLVLCTSTVQGGPMTFYLTWKCGDGNYCADLQCWDPDLGVPPCRISDLATFDVTIPSDSGVMTLDCDCDVNDFTLGAGREFKVIGGNTYSVTGRANISGLIHGNGGSFIAPKAAFAGCGARAFVDGGATVEIGAPLYCATGPGADGVHYTLLSSDGPGSILNLRAVRELDDGISADDVCSHAILAHNSGKVDLSGLNTLVGPGGNSLLDVRAINGVIDMSSLRTMAGNIRFTTDAGGTLILGNVNARNATSVTLNDANDLFVASGDLDLGTTLTIANPGRGTCVLTGDFSHAYRDETEFAFDQLDISFGGEGPQELEVGGLDAGLLTAMLRKDDQGNIINFGFGQLRIGRDDPSAANAGPGAVLLVDRIDNGNRNAGRAEALYLLGKDGQDGLRLLNGSTLYMGGLKVYATIGGTLADLRTLFRPGETTIPLDGGFLCLHRPRVDDPGNLLCNGGFETGRNPPTADDCTRLLRAESTEIDCWMADQNGVSWTHEACFVDAGEGERFADLSSMTAAPEGSTEGHTQAVSQVIQTVPGTLYHLWFDVAVNPCRNSSGDAGQRSLTVSAAGTSETFTFDSVTEVNWQTRTWRFRAAETTTALTFTGQDEPTTGCGVAIDNVCVFLWPADGTLRPTVAVAMCLDVSGSMSTPATLDMEDAVAMFVRAMAPQDRGEIIKFADGVEVTEAFTNDKEKLIAAISRMFPFSWAGTFLYDAICRAVTDTAAQACGRKAVIVLTDGRDAKSKTWGIDDAIGQAQSAAIPVFTIGLGTEIDEAVLRRIAEETGGVYYDAPTSDELESIYRRISETLSHQYLIAHSSTR